MIVVVLIIIAGALVTYFSLIANDCNYCWRRDGDKVRTARCGLAMVLFGCVMVVYQFWFWG